MGNRNLPKRLSSFGFSLIETMAGLGMLSVILAAIAGLTINSQRQAVQLVDRTQVDIFRRQLVNLLQNEISWQQTVLNNPSMGCLRTPGKTCLNSSFAKSLNFAVYDGSGTQIYDALPAKNGFTETGVICTGFSATNATPKCPFRFDLRWYAVSSSLTPLVAIAGILQVSPGTFSSLNTTYYSIGQINGANVLNPLFRSAQ